MSKTNRQQARAIAVLLTASLLFSPYVSWGRSEQNTNPKQSMKKNETIPLRCEKYVTFDDGSTHKYRLEIVINEKENIVQKIDGTTLASSENVEISDRHIKYVIYFEKSTNVALIDRATGAYSDESTVPSLNNKKLQGTGSCEPVKIEARKF